MTVRCLNSPLRRVRTAACDCLQVLRDGGAGAVHFGDALRRRAEHGGEFAEARDQRFCERLGVSAWDGAEEQEFEQLVVRKRAGPASSKRLAQARAVVVIVRLALVSRRSWADRLEPAAMAPARSSCEQKQFARLRRASALRRLAALPERPAMRASMRRVRACAADRAPQATW